MKTQDTPNPMLARSPEPFEEVWMFPKGWDLSEMADKPVQKARADADDLPLESLLFTITRLSV